MGTVSYAVRRLLLAVVTLIGITMITFALVALAPGDPAALQSENLRNPEAYQKIRQQIVKQFDLDKPIPVRYARWMKKLLTGNLGESIADHRPVADKIHEALGPTLLVNIAGLILAFGIAVPLGIASAWKQGGVVDRGMSLLLYAMYSIPSFVGAILLVLLVAVKWNLLPFRGMHGDTFEGMSAGARAVDTLRHMVLYVACTTYGSLAYYSRFVRGNLLEVIRQDYIRTAKAKGLSGRDVVLKHAFRNTLIPLVTLVGLVFPTVLSGSVILEVIFTWPGIGRLFFDSVLQRDFPVVMALSTATAVLVLVSTLVADLLYSVVDPRVSHG
jgi:peptide/nickel transport system permease protein